MTNRVLRYALRVLLVLACLAAVVAVIAHVNRETDPQVCAAIARRRLTSVYLGEGVELSCKGVETHKLASSSLARAVAQDDPRVLAEALAQKKAAGIAVSPREGGGERNLAERFASLLWVPEHRAVALTPELAVYAPYREPDLSAREREAVAYVARALFRGAREPSLNSFPSRLRRVDRVEVMVTLSEHGQPRLWRSARGTSIARTLLTATRVARDRWHEREQAMGGPLYKRLLTLDVEVSLLTEDGTIANTQPAFVDRAITEQHGLGFDYRNGWHYISPEEVRRRGKGSAYKALLALLADQGLGPTALSDPNLRLYRFVPIMLGVSKAPISAAEVSGD